MMEMQILQKQKPVLQPPSQDDAIALGVVQQAAAHCRIGDVFKKDRGAAVQTPTVENSA